MRSHPNTSLEHRHDMTQAVARNQLTIEGEIQALYPEKPLAMQLAVQHFHTIKSEGGHLVKTPMEKLERHYHP